MKYSRFPFMVFLAIGLCLFIFPELPLLLPQNPQIDGILRENTESIKEGNLLKAWNTYKKLLENKDQDLTHIVTEVSPGYYKNVQEVILKKMAEILEKPTLPEEIKIEVDTFFTNLKTPEKSDIKKVRPYLPSIKGFKLFQKFGEDYLEEGDCTQAILLWEEAKDISLGYKHLDRGDKALFLTQLGYCYKQLGLNDKLKALFNENPDLKKAGILLNSKFNIPFKKELLSSLGTVAQALKELNAYAQTCPVDFESTASEKDLSVQYSKEGYEFISKPITLHNRVYILSKNKNNDIFLLTLNKNTGTLLNEQYIEQSRVAHVYFKNGKINIVTPFDFYEANLDGNIVTAINAADDRLAAPIRNQGNEYRIELANQLGSLAESKCSSPNVNGNENLKEDLWECGQILAILGNMGKINNTTIQNLVQKKLLQIIMSETTTVVDVGSALLQLGQGVESVTPLLVQYALSPTNSTRIKAAQALSDLIRNGRAQSAIQTFIEKLSDPDPGVRVRAVSALEQIGRKASDATPSLISLLNDSNGRVVAEAATALGTVGWGINSAIEALTGKLSDPDPVIRGNAIAALGEMGDVAHAALPDLIRAASTDGNNRIDAIEAIGKMGEKADIAVPMIIDQLGSSTNTDVRMEAARSLGTIESKISQTIRIQALIKALSDREDSVRNIAKAALTKDIGKKALVEFKKSENYQSMDQRDQQKLDGLLDSIKW